MSDAVAKNTAVPAVEAAKVVPRAEFRVFGHGIIDIIQEKMGMSGPFCGRPEKSRRRRISSLRTDEAKVKVREGLLDIKTKVGETPEGYEIFQPRGKFQFPVKRADLRSIPVAPEKDSSDEG